MTRLLRALNFDLLLEQGGYQCRIEGTGDCVTVALPSLPSLIHFARLFWPLRHSLPSETLVRLRWGPFRWQVRGTALWKN